MTYNASNNPQELEVNLRKVLAENLAIIHLAFQLKQVPLDYRVNENNLTLVVIKKVVWEPMNSDSQLNNFRGSTLHIYT